MTEEKLCNALALAFFLIDLIITLLFCHPDPRCRLNSVILFLIEEDDEGSGGMLFHALASFDRPGSGATPDSIPLMLSS